MKYFEGTNTQISPCIAAKAKYALGLTSKKPSNNETCSHDYWLRVIKTFANKHNVSNSIKQEAINKYNHLIKTT